MRECGSGQDHSEGPQQLLRAQDLITGYGNKRVLNGASITVGPGEIVALIGHNGAGKSTFLKAIFGLLPIWRGEVKFDGSSLSQLTCQQILREGVAYVPQGNRVFADLTVSENLHIGGFTLGDRVQLAAGVDRALTFFPPLKSRLGRKAGTLSGGEKQMLALASILILSPRLLLLDEPSLGLAPPFVLEAFRHIEVLSKESGVAILLVEQKVREVLKMSRRVYVLRNGQVSFQGPPELLDDARLREVYF